MTVRCLSLLLISVFLTFVIIRPSYAQGISCGEIALDPRDGTGWRILERFYVQTDGVGGLGCWYHAHPNGKDGLVTPFSWGQMPGPQRMALINSIFEATTKSRQKLSPLGSLDNALFVVLRDTWVGLNAEAYWPKDEQCWMEAQLNNQSIRGSDRSILSAVIAHEIGHCFIMENIDGYLPSNYQEPLDRWWDESGAEYYSTIVYPELDHEHSFARSFVLDVMPFTQWYDAYVVFAHYAQLHGDDSVLELLKVIFSQRSNDALLNYLRNQEFDKFFHDFAITHYSMKVVDSGGGFIPRSDDFWPVLNHRLDPNKENHLPLRFIALPDLDGSRLNVIELNIPVGYSLEISSPANETLGLFVSLQFENDLIENWTSPFSIEANCDQERLLTILTTHLRTAPIENQKLAFSLVRNPNCGQCVPNSESIREYGPDGKYGSPDYVPLSELQAKAICALSCEYRCLCDNRSLWADRPVTEAECLSVHPSGGDPIVNNVPYPATLCQRFAGIYVSMSTGIIVEDLSAALSAEDMLDYACTSRCTQNCLK